MLLHAAGAAATHPQVDLQAMPVAMSMAVAMKLLMSAVVVMESKMAKAAVVSQPVVVPLPTDVVPAKFPTLSEKAQEKDLASPPQQPDPKENEHPDQG